MGDPRDTSWIAIGDQVVYLDRFGRPEGMRCGGPVREDGTCGMMVVGCVGRVVEVRPGSAAHACPGTTHDDDCYCSGDRVIAERSSYAVVEYDADDGGPPIRRAIMRDEEGQDWRRARVLAEGTK